MAISCSNPCLARALYAALAAIMCTACASKPGIEASSGVTVTTSQGITTLPQIAAAPAPATTTTVPLPGEQRDLVIAGSPVRLQYDTATPEKELAAIGEYIVLAREELGDTGPLTVYIYNDVDAFVTAYSAVKRMSLESARQRALTITAEAGHRQIWFYMPPILARGERPPRYVTTVHEYFHTLQYAEASTVQSGLPRWLVEGTANYFSAEALATRGLINIEFARQNILRLTRDVSNPLSSLEARDATIDEATFLGQLASDYITKTYGHDRLKKDYWSALRGRNWRQVFLEVFGVSVDQFYSDFESYRQSLR